MITSSLVRVNSTKKNKTGSNGRQAQYYSFFESVFANAICLYSSLKGRFVGETSTTLNTRPHARGLGEGSPPRYLLCSLLHRACPLFSCVRGLNPAEIPCDAFVPSFLSESCHDACNRVRRGFRFAGELSRIHDARFVSNDRCGSVWDHPGS